MFAAWHTDRSSGRNNRDHIHDKLIAQLRRFPVLSELQCVIWPRTSSWSARSACGGSARMLPPWQLGTRG